MKYCQSPRCHYYNTNDRLRGNGGDKNFQTRKRSKLYFGGGNFCTLNCQNDWFEVYGSRAIDHFGRITTPKKRDKNTPNFWAIRNEVVDRLYGTGGLAVVLLYIAFIRLLLSLITRFSLSMMSPLAFTFMLPTALTCSFLVRSAFISIVLPFAVLCIICSLISTALYLGFNVAVVFNKLPETYFARPVISGDETDVRFEDARGVIVGLTAKGKAKKDLNNFVIKVA